MSTLPNTLDNIPFENAAPSLVLESDLYHQLLRLILEIAESTDDSAEKVDELCVNKLVLAFQRLLKGGRQWEQLDPASSDEGVIQCKDILLKLRDVVQENKRRGVLVTVPGTLEPIRQQ